MEKNTQKFYNRERDKVMSQGTFKIAYDKSELKDERQRGVKMVDKKTLPYFVTNEYEKQNLHHPDAMSLFTKKGVTQFSNNQQNTESVRIVLFEDARPHEQMKEQQENMSRQPMKTNKKMKATKDLLVSSQVMKDNILQSRPSYLDNYRKHKKNDQDQKKPLPLRNQPSDEHTKPQPRKGKRILQTTIVFMQQTKGDEQDPADDFDPTGGVASPRK